MSGGSSRDLRRFQDAEAIQNAFSALVSGGKPGYKTIIERKKEVPRCSDCNLNLTGDEKFCPECGTKILNEIKA